MANQVEKLNGIAITSIEKINGATDSNIEKINGLEFTGIVLVNQQSRSFTTVDSSGSAIGDTREIEAQGWNINNFTVVDTHLGLRYNEMIAPMIKAIQELSTKVTELENQISGSE